MVRGEKNMNDNILIKNNLKYLENQSPNYFANDKNVKIKSFPVEYYKLPNHAELILGKCLYSELIILLSRVRSINDNYASMTVAESHIMINGDTEVLRLRKDLLTWAAKYCSKRHKKIYNMFDDKPVDGFDKIMEELWPYLNDLCDRNNMHHQILFEMLRFIPWYLYKNSWQKYVRFSFNDDETVDVNFNGNFIKDENIDGCNFYLHNYNWVFENSMLNFYNQTRDKVVISTKIKSMSNHDKLQYLSEMASDINEMRPFLIKNYNMAKSGISLRGGLHVAWDWKYDHMLGSLILYDTPYAPPTSCIDMNKFLFINIDNEGVMTNPIMTWLKTTNLNVSSLPSPIDLNIALIELIHDKLFSFYEKIDIHKILNQQTDVDNSNLGLLDENIAASCQMIAASDIDDQDNNRVVARFIRQIRVQKFLNILENKLGCSVKNGKGSEITMYRKNGKKYRIGHHKKNPYVASIIVKNILQRLNISWAEWKEAI